MSSANPEALPKLHLLQTGEQYQTWKPLVYSILNAAGLVKHHVKGNKPRENAQVQETDSEFGRGVPRTQYLWTRADQAQTNKLPVTSITFSDALNDIWEENEITASGHIRKYLHPSVAKRLTLNLSTKEIWEWLETEFTTTTTADLERLTVEFKSLRIGTDLHLWLSNYVSVHDQIRQLAEELPTAFILADMRRQLEEEGHSVLASNLRTAPKNNQTLNFYRQQIKEAADGLQTATPKSNATRKSIGKEEQRRRVERNGGTWFECYKHRTNDHKARSKKCLEMDRQDDGFQSLTTK